MRASVSRWKGQKTYRAVWTDPITGKLKRRDTGCATRTDAQAWLAAWLAGTMPGSPFASGASGVGSPPARTDVTFEELCEDYLTRKKRGAGDSQRWNLRVPIQRLGKRHVSDLTCHDFEKLRDQLLKEGRKTGTVRRYLSACVAALNWGRKTHQVSGDVSDSILGGLVLPASGAASKTYLTKEQRDLWFQVCVSLVMKHDRNWRAALAVCLALGTAARREAILGLTWDRVLWEAGGAGVIDYRDPLKTESNKRRVAVPMSAEVRQILEVARDELSGGSPYVFVSPTAPIRRGFEQIRRLIGSDMSWVTFKVFRATWASLNAQRGVPMDLIAAGLGDDLETTRKHYAHLSPEHLRSAFE
jgi:integrase